MRDVLVHFVVLFLLACAPPEQSEGTADASPDVQAPDLAGGTDILAGTDAAPATDAQAPGTDADVADIPDVSDVSDIADAADVADIADVSAPGTDVAPEVGPDAAEVVGSDAVSADCGPAPKLCSHTFVYAGDGSEASVELRGSFNGWKSGIALSASGTDWSVTANMPYNTAIQYKFRILKLGGGEVWVTDPGNSQTVSDGSGNTNSLLAASSCDPWICGKLQTICGVDAKSTAFDWSSGVMYFAFVDRFFDGDSTNNGGVGTIPAAVDWHGGDWAGIQQKIVSGYFGELGVNIIWLTVPLDPTAALEYGDDGKKYTGYHGYWPRDREKTNAHFGTMQELQNLVQTAHAAGIQIVLDYAMNHVHTSSPVWQAHQNDGWFHGLYVQGQNCTCGSNVCPWEGPSGLYCWFTTYLPDFDFASDVARKASIDNVIWWLQQSGADGLRLDAIKHVESAWLTDLRARLLTDVEPQRGQHIWLVGETFSGDQAYLKTFVDPCTKLDGQFDFAERATVDSTILLRQGKMADLEGFLNGNDGYFGQDALMSPFVGNHDLPRVIHFAEDPPLWTDIWANGKDKAWTGQPTQPTAANAYERVGVAMTILMTNPGVPLIYYGDEIGLAGAGDPDNRRPMQWSGYNAGQTALLAKMKALGQARKNHPALRKGTRKTLWMGQDAWLYQREFQTDFLIVALNRADNPVTASGVPAGTWTDLLGGPEVTGPNVTIPARGAKILLKKP